MLLRWTYLLCALPLIGTAQVTHEVQQLDLGVNTEDYSPFPVEDGFIMSSLRASGGAIDLRDDRTGKPLADLYFVSLKDGKTGTPELFSEAITTAVNEGPAALTSDRSEICYTRNIVLPKKLSNLRSAGGELGLFFSRKKDGQWQAPTAFEHNSSKYSLMHPTFSRGGDTIYFASDMPGGHGGLDLYMSVRSGNGWSAPIDLGATINSEAHEAFPRMQANGDLHFSSDRTGGLGKLDIYSSRKKGEGWTSPLPFPAPINSEANDVGYTLFADGFNGIMSSDRSGMDRILLVKYTIEKFRDCTEQRINNYCFAFKGRKHAATSSLPVEHAWDMGDGTVLKGHAVNHCYAGPGKYVVRSMLIDRKSGAVFYEINNNELVVEEIEQAFVAAPDTVRTGRQLVLDPSLSHLPGMNATEYHWDLGDGNVRSTPRVIHQYRTAGEYEVKLDILGKPDAEGAIDHRCNTKKIVVLDKYREQEDQTMVAVYQDAFGRSHSFEFQELPFDEMAMAMDESSDVVFSVTLFASVDRVSLEDPRFLEIKKHYRVIERYDPERNVYTYSVGETKDIEELYEVYRKVKELQFLDAEVFAIEMEKLVDMSTLEIASLKELDHTKLRTSLIHFDFNSAVLGEGSGAILDQVFELMEEHAELHVVIEAHTDDIGSFAANMELSQERAASVVEYLTAKGIKAERMVPIGHGENQPIASNKNEEGRGLNRRVEFRLVVKAQLPSLVNVK